LARQLNLPFVDLGGFDIDPKALTHVPQTIARRFCLAPLCLYGDALVIAMNDPTDSEAVDTVRFVSGRRVEIAKASESAIESALTGHLVLSTLHTSDAAGAVTRLAEMGIEPFLLNATVLGVLAQRLVRRNCPHCVQEEPPDPGVRRALGVTDGEIFYKGAGCEYCNATGYIGRVAVYELLTLTPQLRTMIQEGICGESLGRQAVAQGMVPLTQNALSLARRRATSLAEVYRVRLL